MPEQKNIPSQTIATTTNTTVTIVTQYTPEGPPHIINSSINDKGEGVVTLKDSPTLSQAELNNGQLVIQVPSEEVNQYYINTNGELIWDPNL